MKRISSYLFIAIAFLSGCVREEPQETVRNTLRVSKRLNPGSAGPEELDLYAFRRSDGCLETISSGSGDSISVNLVKGREYNLYLIGNGHGIAYGIGDEEEFLQKRIRLEDNDPARPLFFSSAISYKCLDEEPLIGLRRYLSRISIKEIRSEWLEDMPCKVTMIAVVNASGSIPLSGIPDDKDICYNRAGVMDELSGKIRDMLVWEGEIDIRTSSMTGLSLYTLPNSSTRLAIRVAHGSEINWYPVELPVMRCNTDYEIDCVVIKGPGSPGPDQEIDRRSVSFDITVKPWENENIDVDFSI